MSRNGPTTARNLSLTEELERLEQSITLTLQEIDSNFSKSHRIVTTSILPLVEQYGEHSRNVWEASKFWKQFFEASANVSLSGYEELTNDDEDTTTATAEETTVHADATTAEYTPRKPRNHGMDTTVTGDDDESSAFQHQDRGPGTDDSVLSEGDGTLTGSTPRPPATKTLSVRPQFAGLGSPYDLLRREMKKKEAEHTQGGAAAGDGQHDSGGDDESDTELLFQQHTARLPDMSMTPRSSFALGGGDRGLNVNGEEDDDDSPFLVPGAAAKKSKDPLLHRVLDKNYRLMATPHKGQAGLPGMSPIRWRVTEKKLGDHTQTLGKGKEKEENRPIWADSPMSSPEMAIPKLRSEAFMSPVRVANRNKTRSTVIGVPRTPGVSVQTPATARKTREVYNTPGQATPAAERDTDEITWESSDDDEDDIYGGMSPPKTINFALPPSKLMQTPARVASKRIVEDILLTAGAEPDEDEGEYSPTMVKTNANVLDDTF